MASNRRHRSFLPSTRRDLLARLLWNLARRDWKGTIHLTLGKKQWSVTLAGRRVRGIELWNAEDLRLGNLLQSLGQASLNETNRAAKLAQRQCRLQGQVLTDRGLPGPMLEEALRKQARMRFARFMDQAEGWLHVEPDARISARALLGRPVDLAQALLEWAGTTEIGMGAQRRRTWHFRWEARERSGQDLVTLLPQRLQRVAERWLARGQLSWQDLRTDLIEDPRLGVSFQEILWSWFCLLERLGLAVSTPSGALADGPDESVNPPVGPPGPTKAATNLKKETCPALPEGADPETLRRWWHQMARRYHPDSNPTADPEAFHEAHKKYLAALARYHRHT